MIYKRPNKIVVELVQCEHLGRDKCIEEHREQAHKVYNV
jgi:hypothetical protein